MSNIKTALYSKFVVVKTLAWLSAVVIWSHLAIAQSGGEVELAAPADEFKASEKLAIEFGGATGEITYYNTRGKAIIEGDIVIGTEEEIGLIRMFSGAGIDFGKLDVSGDPNAEAKLSAASPRERSLRELGTRAVAIKALFGGKPRRWSNGVMPFEIDPNLPGKQRITQAMGHLEANSKLRFVQRTAQNASTYPNYVYFTAEGGGCSSFVGVRGGRQEITLEAACSLGNTIHEIAHAAGMQHEQTRGDRDRFVRVNWDNIIPNMRGNFAVNTTQNEDIGGYDYGSLMHYPRRAFAINPSQDTLQPLQNIEIGQRATLSRGDIAGLQRLYP